MFLVELVFGFLPGFPPGQTEVRSIMVSVQKALHCWTV